MGLGIDMLSCNKPNFPAPFLKRFCKTSYQAWQVKWRVQQVTSTITQSNSQFYTWFNVAAIITNGKACNRPSVHRFSVLRPARKKQTPRRFEIITNYQAEKKKHVAFVANCCYKIPHWMILYWLLPENLTPKYGSNLFYFSLKVCSH